jgi:glutamate carboxypeptidase
MKRSALATFATFAVCAAWMASASAAPDARIAALAAREKPALLQTLNQAHSADAEYVLIDSIEPRLSLSAQLIMDISRDKVSAP